MSIRRVFQILTIALALAFSFSATTADTAYACDPTGVGGYC
ncbi:MAG TPA: hypothetical protein VJQ09_06650 [Candidatus Limnocylindria bacterium]|nr:hypothetical protein [Candidatus Limnocylindria bacterium]